MKLMQWSEKLQITIKMGEMVKQSKGL